MPLKAVIKDLLISNGVLASSRVAGILSDPAKPDDPVLRAAEISYKALGLGKPQATISVNIYDIEQAIINQEAAKRGIELI